jgi:hypothetical protein
VTLRRVLLLLAVASCDDNTSYYLYYANRYEPGRDCVDHAIQVDLFNAPNPGNSCTPTCFPGHDQDGAAIVYASTMCGPVPVEVDASGGDPLCPSATAALTRKDFCLDGGGSTNPIMPPDATD